jgi:hypothetical protein
VRLPPDLWRIRPEFISGLVRLGRGTFFAALALFLLLGIYGGEAVLFEPFVVHPATAYAVTIAFGALSLAAAFWVRGPFRWISRLAFATTLLCFALHFILLDGLIGSVVGAFEGPEETQYAKRYSAIRFRLVARGMTRKQVLDSLGEPLVDIWSYVGPSSHETNVDFEHDRVTHLDFGQNPPVGSVSLGMTSADILRRMGSPSATLFLYSQGRESYCERVIRFRRDRVVERISDFYWD